MVPQKKEKTKFLGIFYETFILNVDEKMKLQTALTLEYR